MNYSVVIPSYRRVDLLRSKTLRCLEQTDIRAQITVFVADKKEYAVYRAALPRHIEVEVGKRGIPNQRNHIQRCYPENAHLLFLDDDLQKIVGLDSNGKRVRAVKMHKFIQRAFEDTHALGMRMWGINSTDSNLEMKNTVSVGRIYLVGNFYGLINTHSLYVDEGKKIPLRKQYAAGKESHERALLMWEHFGGVSKYRCFGVRSSYWGTPGGHQESRTAAGEEQATHYLHNKYPNDTRIREHKGFVDLIIKPKTLVRDYQCPQPAEKP
jgi:hypothetical protein